MKTSYELKAQARLALKDTYWYIFVILLIITGVLSASNFALIGFIITGPVMVGFSFYLLQLFRQTIRADKLEHLLIGFKEGLVSHIITYIVVTVLIFLWSLLLIIPGIIKAIAYSQVGFILAENRNLEYKEAIERSESMMQGHKMRYFELILSFIGWYLLSILTFGIGLIFLAPYIQMTFVCFYEDIKIKQLT
jgi:uncharacterized membrane protein